MGGANPSIFEHGDKCIRVVAEDTDGNQVSPEVGPLPLTPPAHFRKGPFCLTPQAPGFLFSGVNPGGLVVKLEAVDGTPLKMRYTNSGLDRTSILIF